MVFRTVALMAGVAIFCSTANAGMNCSDPESVNNVSFPRRTLSNNALQKFFAYAVVNADVQANNNVFINKIVGGLKNPQIVNFEDGFDYDQAYNIFVNHAAVRPGLKSIQAPCGPSDWTTYTPTLFYYLAVSKKANTSQDGKIYGNQVVQTYRELVIAFNKEVKKAKPWRRKAIERCLIDSKWNSFLHNSSGSRLTELKRAVEGGKNDDIRQAKILLKSTASREVNTYAMAAVACALR